MLKTKSIANSPLLPSTVKLSPYKLDAAGINVVARLCNARVVKETIKTVLLNIQMALGNPTKTKNSGTTEKELPAERIEDIPLPGHLSPSRRLDQRVPSVAYEHCELGGESRSDNASPRLTREPESTMYNISTKSAFLPALTAGGYWSGSGSEADDDEIAEELIHRKNRPGQRARRQLWEKKYGSNAKHLREGQSGHGGWDARRGAIQGPQTYQRREHKSSHPRHRRDVKMGMRNAVSREDENRHKTSNVPLHPSWEAAKKLKQQMKATHKGTKIIFD